MGILSTSQPVCVSTCSLYQCQKEQSLSRTRLLLTGLRQVVDNWPFKYYFRFCLSQWSFCAWENLGLWGPVSCDCKHAGYVQQQWRGSVLFGAWCHELLVCVYSSSLCQWLYCTSTSICLFECVLLFCFFAVVQFGIGGFFCMFLALD